MIDKYDESALAYKLAEEFHLNVAERRSLPSSGISVSALLVAIQSILDECSWFPRDWRPDQPFDGIVIEATQMGFNLHERSEIGMARFSDAETTTVSTIKDAVRKFLSRTYCVSNIDGIPIDWSR